MKNNKKAFTLTELLVALGIVGAIAALSIPSLMNSINKKIYATQLKSFVGSVQQLAVDQMLTNKTKDLELTDFKSTGILTAGGFDVAKSCTAAASTDCLKTTAYKTIDDPSNANKYRVTYDSVKLKNGAVVMYRYYASGTKINAGTPKEDYSIGEFLIDLNGDEAPNIYGRDFFSFYISKRGVIIPEPGFIDVKNKTFEVNDASKAECTAGNYSYCFGLVMNNGWVMDY